MLIDKQERNQRGFTLKNTFAPSIIYDYENIFLSHALDYDIKHVIFQSTSITIVNEFLLEHGFKDGID